MIYRIERYFGALFFLTRPFVSSLINNGNCKICTTVRTINLIKNSRTVVTWTEQRWEDYRTGRQVVDLTRRLSI